MTSKQISLAVAVLSTCACLGQKSPLACNLKAFTPGERKEWRVRLDQVMEAVTSTRELPDGYEFRLNPSQAPVTDVARWIDLERKCCPFFDFQLILRGETGELSFGLQGREGVKEFIAMDFHVRREQPRR